MSRYGHNYKTLNKYIDEFGIDVSKISENRKNVNKNHLRTLHKNNSVPLEDIIFGDGKIKYKGALKERLISAGYKERKCECCGLTMWLDKPIPLQLHHKDGNHDNNLFENLELLCPNCHSLTDTFAGKNIKHNADKARNKRNTVVLEICPVCGKNYKYPNAKMCLECFRKSQEPPTSREKLKDEIRKLPFT